MNNTATAPSRQFELLYGPIPKTSNTSLSGSWLATLTAMIGAAMLVSLIVGECLSLLLGVGSILDFANLLSLDTPGGWIALCGAGSTLAAILMRTDSKVGTVAVIGCAAIAAGALAVVA